MVAYKFLAEGAIGPFTRFEWPRPGSAHPWVSAPVNSTDDAWIHACRVVDLPYWLGAELWSVELDEPVVEARYQIASPRGRLLEQVMGWNRRLEAELALDCALRARDLAAPHVAPDAREVLLAANDAAALQAVSGRLHAAGAEVAAYVNTAAASAAAGAVAVSAFVLEMLVGALGGDPADERLRQARWIAGRLQLQEV